MSNIKLKNLLAENMRRFGTKNLNEDHPGIIYNLFKLGASAPGIIKGLKDYFDMFKGKSKEESDMIVTVFNIQNMIRQDKDPDAILKYIKSRDSKIDDIQATEIIVALAKQMGVYVDLENDGDASPLT